MTPNNQGNQSGNSQENFMLARLQSRDAMMNELMQRRVSELTAGQGHSLSEIAALHGSNQDAVATAIQANNLALAMELSGNLSGGNGLGAATSTATNLDTGLGVSGYGNNLSDHAALLQQYQQQQPQVRRNSSLRPNQSLFQEHARRNSSIGLSGLLGNLNDDNINNIGNINNINTINSINSINNNINNNINSINNINTLNNLNSMRSPSMVSPHRRNTMTDRRSSLDMLGETAAAVDIRERIANRRNSLESTTNSLDQSSHSLLNNLTNVDSQILRTEAELARRKADLQLTLARNGNDLSHHRNSLELSALQRRKSLDLALQQRRASLELAQGTNSFEQAQRRHSFELARRRSSLDLVQRRSSLDHLAQQRRNSLDNLAQQRRNSLDTLAQQRRSSLDHLAQRRRNSLDHLAQRRNSADLINNNPRMSNLSHLLAEQMLADKRHTLSLGRNTSLQTGIMDPIDPRHIDSLFEGNSQAGIALGLQQPDDIMRSLRQQSLLETLTRAGNSHATSPQDRLLNAQAAQMQASSNEMIDSELAQQQVSPFLNAVDSLQQRMQKSQLSQKSIQTWDKKMGLKRSHSSTMTKTHRSRKQLKELFEMQKRFLEQKMGNNSNSRKRSLNNM
jgi:hypothetical protein